MVYIKKIEMRGFKTYGRKVTLHLDRGFTVMTGPNGSGKSNVLDGVKFALGELSPKELRGASLGDLVHRASPTESARSAHVSVQFDNSDRRLPVDSDIVTISREFQRGGEGVYRLNGRRVSRKQLGDVLSSADILLTGHNLVPQHSITRLAEVTSEERRRIIEDLIGIGVYDAKREEAKVQLDQADLNIRIASARIEEVRARVEALERERNDYLRSEFLRAEVNKVNAQLLSHKLGGIEGDISRRRQELAEREAELREVKGRLEALERSEGEMRHREKQIERTIEEKGGLGEVDARASEVRAEFAGVEARAQSSESAKAFLADQMSKAAAQADSLKQTVDDLTSKLVELRAERDRIASQLQPLAAEQSSALGALERMRSALAAQGEEYEEYEREITALNEAVNAASAQIKASTTKIALLRNYVENLRSRRSEYAALIEELGARADELERLRVEEERRAGETANSLVEYQRLQEGRRVELKEALQVVKRASLSVVEFQAKREVAEAMDVEERALSRIEALGKEGGIEGIFGRLGELVQFPERYRKAVEASSKGWLRALVARDMETAARCVESLKRTKLGRVKIIPLDVVAGVEPVAEPPRVEGVLGRMVDFVGSEAGLRPAVNYVFGDTVLAESQRAAYLCSLEGLRAVVIGGDLFEPGGAVEGGYYRRPLETRALAEKEGSLEALWDTVKSLQDLAERGRRDVERLAKEVEALKAAKAGAEVTAKALRTEYENLMANLERCSRSLSSTERRLEELGGEIAEETRLVEEAERSKMEAEGKLVALTGQPSAAFRSEATRLIELENRYAQLLEEVNELRRADADVLSRIRSIEAMIEVHQSTLSQLDHQRDDLVKEVEKCELTMGELRAREQELRERLAQIEESKTGVAADLTLVKQARDQLGSELERLEREGKELSQRLDPLNDSIRELNSRLVQLETEGKFLRDQLGSTGLGEPLPPEVDIKRLEAALERLKREAEAIGQVNALAVKQYEEVYGNYRQLSSRINEVEKEKLAILSFMNELEKQKLETFTKAFNQVNSAFQEVFAQLTSGGEGKLVLEDEADPFKGGVDVFLQFPGKHGASIRSASGGERSVGTVTFLLALQSIHPMPFYFFDEIDAHMDTLNTKRLADLLKDRSKGSQFVVISLKDTTISKADRVYGAFIQDGVSQIVQMPMVEAR